MDKKIEVQESNTNLTARIESYTVGGQVFISGATLEEAGGTCDVAVLKEGHKGAAEHLRGLSKLGLVSFAERVVRQDAWKSQAAASEGMIAPGAALQLNEAQAAAQQVYRLVGSRHAPIALTHVHYQRRVADKVHAKHLGKVGRTGQFYHHGHRRRAGHVTLASKTVAFTQ